MSLLTVAGQETARWSMSAIAPLIAQVQQKCETGVYPLQPVSCFCGNEDDSQQVTVRDRFFMPHRMVLCPRCCLFYATPRMTSTAYRDYYNDEYRKIYDPWEFREQDSQERRFMRQAAQGVSFAEFLEYYDLHPKSILDLGCNTGGFLRPLRDLGVTVTGLDWCEDAVAFGQQSGLNLMVGGIDEALAKGLSVDMIVLQDVVEHLLDLRDLTKLHGLLKPGGYVYVGTPGFFRSNPATFWQNAHPYAFCAETLRYVMRMQGFAEYYLDEEITSLWKAEPSRGEDLRPPGWYRPYILEHLQGATYRRMPPIRTINKFTVSERKQNIQSTLKCGFPDVSALPKVQHRDLVIVGGGPSVTEQTPTIQRLVAEGKALMVIERMYPWTATVGLHPDYVTALDGSDDVVEGFAQIQPDTIHLVGSSMHPDVAAMLPKDRTYVYHGHNPHFAVQQLWMDAGYTRVTVVNTGGSVTLACLALAMRLGFRRIHLFGFDCMVQTPEHSHATGIAGANTPHRYLDVQIGEETFVTSLAFLSFAQQYAHMVSDGKKAGLLESVQIYGESLVTKLVEDRTCPSVSPIPEPTIST